MKKTEATARPFKMVLAYETSKQLGRAMRAVNAHDGLVEALEDLLAKGFELADVVNRSGDHQELLDYMESETKAKQALKLTKGA